MAFCGDELWIANTLFSCLVTLDERYHFVPRWKPKFISAIAGPEDRCHLNGLAPVDGKIKYVTAMSETDTPQGWRPNKVDGGVVIDVLRRTRSSLVAWRCPTRHAYTTASYGCSTLVAGRCLVDERTGQRTVVTTFPGYCRGMSFFGCSPSSACRAFARQRSLAASPSPKIGILSSVGSRSSISARGQAWRRLNLPKA